MDFPHKTSLYEGGLTVPSQSFALGKLEVRLFHDPYGLE